MPDTGPAKDAGRDAGSVIYGVHAPGAPAGNPGPGIAAGSNLPACSRLFLGRCRDPRFRPAPSSLSVVPVMPCMDTVPFRTVRIGPMLSTPGLRIGAQTVVATAAGWAVIPASGRVMSGGEGGRFSTLPGAAAFCPAGEAKSGFPGIGIQAVTPRHRRAAHQQTCSDAKVGCLCAPCAAPPTGRCAKSRQR